MEQFWQVASGKVIWKDERRQTDHEKWTETTKSYWL